jgi:hypothetical protein
VVLLVVLVVQGLELVVVPVLLVVMLELVLFARCLPCITILMILDDFGTRH